jgi:hypothetical protein
LGGNSRYQAISAGREAERFQDAIAVGRDAVAIFRETGDRHRKGIQLSNLGLARLLK